MNLRSFSLTLGLLCSHTVAWNADVHQQIALLSERLISPRTQHVSSRILEPEYNGSIGLAAAWADAYAHTDEGAYSFPWHWIDAHDDPPHHCNVYYYRDCAKEGCVVEAIANQTRILKGCIEEETKRRDGSNEAGEKNAVDVTCAQALKWVVHFIGDISQPLHASSRAAGGNLEKVTFGNETIDLHEVWDGLIIYHDAGISPGPFPNASLSRFFEGLYTRISTGDIDWYDPSGSWLLCEDPWSEKSARRCAMRWAKESNAWSCDYVYGREGWDTEDLKTSGYAEGAFEIVEMQVSKAAVRLADWLDKLVDGGDDPEDLRHGRYEQHGMVVQGLLK